MTSIYHPPTQGSFYVPPQYAGIVALIPPTAGDFARGARTLDPPLVLGLVRPEMVVALRG